MLYEYIYTNIFAKNAHSALSLLFQIQVFCILTQTDIISKIRTIIVYTINMKYTESAILIVAAKLWLRASDQQFTRLLIVSTEHQQRYWYKLLKADDYECYYYYYFVKSLSYRDMDSAVYRIYTLYEIDEIRVSKKWGFKESDDDDDERSILIL